MSYENNRYLFTLQFFFFFYDDTFEQIVRNIAIGSGVILVSVTISLVTAPLAPAVSAILVYGAKAGMSVAFAATRASFVTKGAIALIQTGDIKYSFKQAALSGSEGFKYGAIFGTVSGGAKEAVQLVKAKMNGLTLNAAATIQMQSGLPLDFIKNFHSIEEYEIYKSAGLTYEKLGNTYAYTRPIDLFTKITDQYGKTMTNAERIINGYSPVDPNGIPYELHHIGQMPDSPLAILTKAEHIQGGHDKILHFREGSVVEHGSDWQKQVTKHWSDYLHKYGGSIR